MKRYGKVYIVGAGPGDPELLTMKAYKVLLKADVILHDALVDDSLLEMIPKKAQRYFVGKRAARHYSTQAATNELLFDCAKKHEVVVRLKGGDPFVFGRGFEEHRFLQERNVAVEIIPGISSCTAVPELQKVPVTCRGYSRSFWVMTATTKSGKINPEISVAAGTKATLVILMGLRKLRKIVKLYQEIGQSEMPVMVIQNGSLANERSAVSTMSNIERAVLKNGLSTPAIIVIGEVVSLHPEFVIQEAVKIAS